MANNIAFQPMGNCVVVTAATANVQGNVAAVTAVSPVNQYLVFNTDNIKVLTNPCTGAIPCSVDRTRN